MLVTFSQLSRMESRLLSSRLTQTSENGNAASGDLVAAFVINFSGRTLRL